MLSMVAPSAPIGLDGNAGGLVGLASNLSKDKILS